MLPPIFRRSETQSDEKPFIAPRAEPGTFHLALTMAGTVSAAAYTAGVVDFLIEAIDAWEKAKAEPAGDAPNHKLVLHAISGTSGGGITAAITAATLFRKFRPMTGETPPPPKDLPATENRLYDTWVRAITLEGLLAIDDLRRGEKPQSLLNSRTIDRIAEQALDMAPVEPPTPGRRAWVDSQLHLFITSANLRGVPYRISFTGTTGLGYPMLGHFNYQHFLVGAAAPRVTWLTHLDPATIQGGALAPEQEGKREGWPALIDAARATSAFPLGFRARRLGHARSFYSEAQWLYPDAALKLTPAKVEPDWYIDYGREPPEERIEFLNVDGGAINNEPFELARVALSGVDGRNPRDAMEADRAVIMIDPLFRPDPGYDPVDEQGNPVKVDGEIMRGRIRRRNDPSIFAVAGSLVGTLIANGRFKPDELGLAADETVFSRFLVAPSAPVIGEKYDRYPIFGELMGAFAAFLHQDLRHYDYRLGRENARAFLLRWFALPEDNPLFAVWPAEKREQWIGRYGVKDRNDQPLRLQRFEGGEAKGAPQRLVPIIPLIGDLKKEIAIAERAPLLRHLNYDFYDFDIGRRIDQLYDAAKREIAAASKGGIGAWLGKIGTGAYLDIGWRTAIRGKLIEQIRAAFEAGRRQAAEKVAAVTRTELRPAATSRKRRNGWHRV